MAHLFLKILKIRNTENSWFSNEPLERVKFLLGEKVKILPSLKGILISFILFMLLTLTILSTKNNEERFNPFLQHHEVCNYHMYAKIDRIGGH